MVSHRCKMMVKELCTSLGMVTAEVELGEVTLDEEISDQQTELLRAGLLELKLELVENKKDILITKIKGIVIDMVHLAEEVPSVKFSAYLSDRLKYDYTYMANLFSETTGTTIEHFIICHKIERAKELIIYGDLKLTDIADKLHYSSVSHLSRQFKKVTGVTPSYFKSLTDKKREGLDNICE